MSWQTDGEGNGYRMMADQVDEGENGVSIAQVQGTCISGNAFIVVPGMAY